MFGSTPINNNYHGIYPLSPSLFTDYHSIQLVDVIAQIGITTIPSKDDFTARL